MAAAEFLNGYLKYDKEEMTDLDITDTKTSAKGDNILYIVMDCPEKILNLRRRIADCNNPGIKTRDFIPPQFWRRYTTIGRIAADWRRNDSELKTQIRFIKDDVRLYTKRKGLNEPFVEVPMEELDETEKVPGIEMNVEWRRRNELPNWRRTSPVIREVK